MKKLIAVFAVLLFVAPAFAADWSFYGSERVATWYVNQDFKDFPQDGQDNDSGTQWYLQGNSRLGAKVKADKVTGQIELATTASSTDSAGDGSVNTRRAYGMWKFSDNASLKVGKDYSPVTDFISNQWFDGDNDLLGNGNFYGRRPQGLTLIIGDFELAFLTPQQGNTGGIGSTTTGILTPATSTALTQANATGDPDVYLPKFEASYMLKLGPGYIKPFAGFQYYSVNSAAPTQDVQDDIDLYSGVLGVSTSWNIGAFSIGGQVSYGMNEGASPTGPAATTPRTPACPYLKAGGDNVADVYTLQAMIVPALKFTDTLRFEAGFG